VELSHEGDGGFPLFAVPGRRLRGAYASRTMRRVCCGMHNAMQPAAKVRRASVARLSGWKAGCGQDCPPHKAASRWPMRNSRSMRRN